jgi:hypothetical protein
MLKTAEKTRKRSSAMYWKTLRKEQVADTKSTRL